MVAGALEAIAVADGTTEARVRAGMDAASVLAELKGLSTEAVFRYVPPAGDSGSVRVDLLNSAGEALALPLPAQQENLDTFPPQIEAHVRASVKDARGHFVEAQAVGFLARQVAP